MSGGVDISCVFPSLVGKYAEARQELLLFTAAQIQTNRGLLFDSNGRRNGGVLWPNPLFRNGQPLAARNNLRKSLGSKGMQGPGGVVRFSGSKVSVGSKLIYAGMMNWGTTGLPGGVLRAKDGKVLRIPLPAGKRATEAAKDARKGGRTEINDTTGQKERVIYRKSVKIPARRFDILTQRDMLEIGRALSNKLAEVLNR